MRTPVHQRFTTQSEDRRAYSNYVQVSGDKELQRVREDIKEVQIGRWGAFPKECPQEYNPVSESRGKTAT